MRSIKDRLPHSPRKRKHVLAAVKQSIEAPGSFSCSEARGRKSLDDAIRANVVSFYERDDISTLAPGQRDYVCVKRLDGSKHRIQKVRFSCLF
jgi:hypothetical protein